MSSTTLIPHFHPIMTYGACCGGSSGQTNGTTIDTGKRCRPCLSRGKAKVCKCCPGRKPPSCVDAFGFALNPNVYSGCNGTLSFEACRLGVPGYVITNEAKPGCRYIKKFTLVPDTDVTLPRSKLISFISSQLGLRARDAKTLCIQLAGPKRIAYTDPDSTPAGQPVTRQAWTVIVCWKPRTWDDIPLGGTNSAGQPFGVQMCIQNRQAVDKYGQNPFPFPSVKLYGYNANCAGLNLSNLCFNAQKDPVEDTLWPKDCCSNSLLPCCKPLCSGRVGCKSSSDACKPLVGTASTTTVTLPNASKAADAPAVSKTINHPGANFAKTQELAQLINQVTVRLNQLQQVAKSSTSNVPDNESVISSSTQGTETDEQDNNEDEKSDVESVDSF